LKVEAGKTPKPHDASHFNVVPSTKERINTEAVI
jgi:hypothetical protein